MEDVLAGTFVAFWGEGGWLVVESGRGWKRDVLRRRGEVRAVLASSRPMRTLVVDDLECIVGERI